MPVFVSTTGAAVEIIRTRPRRAEMPEGSRRRLARDAAMVVLKRAGWSDASIAEAVGLNRSQVYRRINSLESYLGGLDAEDE